MKDTLNLFIIIIFTYFLLTYLDNNIYEKFTSTDELQLKTNRDYSKCKINNDYNKIKSINDYLKQNPQKIPKIIHQIWIGPKKVPWEWINSIKIDFIKKHPDWKYYLWTDKQVKKFILKNKKEFELEKSYAGKSDILRYEILNKYGGIYIDADSYWLGKNLDDLINQTNNTGFFCGLECDKDKSSKCKSNYGLANGVIGSSKNNPITNYLIECVGKNYFKCKNQPAFKTTGPYFVDQILNNFNITIFPYYYFYPIYWHDKKALNLTINEQKKKFPNSYLTQFGYTTNNLN